MERDAVPSHIQRQDYVGSLLKEASSMKKLGHLIAAVGLLALTTTMAHAHVVPLGPPLVTPDGGLFRWTYSVGVTTGETIRKYDYFTIYDFAGYVPGSEGTPANWSFSSANLGVTPAGLGGISDDPSIP